jgi:hypothetical protein
MAVSFGLRDGEVTDGTTDVGIIDVLALKVALNVLFELKVGYKIVAYWTAGEIGILFVFGKILSCQIDHFFAFREQRTFILIGSSGEVPYYLAPEFGNLR